MIVEKIFLNIFSLVLLFWAISIDNAVAVTLSDRVSQFPQWQGKPEVTVAKGDLSYPHWMAGTWQATSTLIEQVAPLAPNLVTPGFADNQRYLDRSIQFQVKFTQQQQTPIISKNKSVVADRAFNGKNIAEAYLGAKSVVAVKVDPHNPNKQITFLRGEKRLISTVTGRATETPQIDRFLATEVSQQLFRSPERIYLNEIETTSDYHLQPSGDITGEQFTAVYLSPQDPDYFKAIDLPVAIYRYRLNLHEDGSRSDSYSPI
jgi:hypothetical protein